MVGRKPWVKNSYYFSILYGASPASPCGLRRARFASAYRMAAPRVAGGEAWWTRPPGPTINRRLVGPWIFPWAPQHAQVAQLVEHATENRSVGGSIPPLGTTNRLSWLKKSPLLAAGHFLLDRRCNPIATARQKNALSALFSDGSAFR
jgi:hypothetical protein